MSNQFMGQSGTVRDRTWLSVLVAIIAVVPGYVVGGLLVGIYKFFLRSYLAGNWIPYLPEIMLIWFPELLRGIVTGLISVGTARLLAKSGDFRVVRYATLAFWGAIIAVLAAFGVSTFGLSLEMIGIAAFVLGFGVGLWGDALQKPSQTE